MIRRTPGWLDGDPSDDDLEALLVLLSLTGMGPNRLRALTSSVPPSEVLAAIRGRRLPPMVGDESLRLPAEVRAKWFGDVESTMATVDLDDHRSNGNALLVPGSPAWPFVDDPDPPMLVFARGDLGLLAESPNVGVVGTRRCTSIGRQVASTLGAELGQAGVGVVSGLALGVDAAAHRGSLAAGGRVVGVVASGLDVVYPASNRDLWEQVGDNGLLLSEVPLGHRPTRWRFPARNRLIAALSDLVVVVESHEEGGALSTVDEATARGIPVGAVPGSTLSPASAGTNALLYDGAIPIRHADDVISLLGYSLGEEHATPTADRPVGQLALAFDELDEAAQRVVDAVQGGAVHLDRLIETLGASPLAIGQMIDDLVARRILVVSGHTVSLSETANAGPTSTRG